VTIRTPRIRARRGQGTSAFWRTLGPDAFADLEVTILDRTALHVPAPNFAFVLDEATRLDRFADRSFDAVFSNSVIEHVGDPAAQRRIADEVVRAGRRYFVQTPNRYFPLEPASSFRASSSCRSRRAWRWRAASTSVGTRGSPMRSARALVRSHPLLSPREMRALFTRSIGSACSASPSR
jgi:SAM-dependent methyltransferase